MFNNTMIAMVMISIAGIASAQNISQSPMHPARTSNKQGDVITVSAAREATDDTKVVLEGVILRKISDDRYEFQDRTGKITAEIDDQSLPARMASNSRLRLYGEVDRSADGVEIDVDKIDVLSH